MDMIRDCRDNKPEGWRYLIAQYIPVIRQYLAHYYKGRAADIKLIERVMMKLRDAQSPLFASPGAGTEREFVAALRGKVLEAVELDKASVEAEVPLDLETMTAALEPLTAMERQMLWMEAMAYTPEETGTLMNLEPSTIAKVRERAEELLRGKMDRWKKGIVADNGFALGRMAEAASGKDCLPGKACLDTLDGRITWKRKQDYDYHVARCWYCVDYFCRLREGDFALRIAKPLSAEETAQFQTLLSVVEEEKPFWKKVFARS